METQDNKDKFRDKIATVNEDGKRIWIYPKKPKGKIYQWRKVVSYVLLAFLFLSPFVKVSGEQLVLLNVIQRKFVFFGAVFHPHDFHLFAFTIIILIVTIILFTVVLGRIFCGWMCPQTIFMEMLFRRIEYFIEGDAKDQKKLNQSKWTREKIIKKGSKNIIFYLISFVIANTFLAYLIGSDELLTIITSSPSEHIKGLSLIMIFSFVFFGVFARFREQVCTTVCPYGRLQGVLTDRNTLLVSYDHERGESREKYRPKQERTGGDCIDCGECVRVCPTGIDIRNGVQLECINCTACIDACDSVMDKVNLPPKLIRYASESSIANKTPWKLSVRAKAYVILLVVLTFAMSLILWNRSSVEVDIITARGNRVFIDSTGVAQNIYKGRFINKSNDEKLLSLDIPGHTASIQLIEQDSIFLNANEDLELTILIRIPDKELDERNNEIIIKVWEGEELVKESKNNFQGSYK